RGPRVTPPTWRGRPRRKLACWTCGREVAPMVSARPISARTADSLARHSRFRIGAGAPRSTSRSGWAMAGGSWSDLGPQPGLSERWQRTRQRREFQRDILSRFYRLSADVMTQLAELLLARGKTG